LARAFTSVGDQDLCQEGQVDLGPGWRGHPQTKYLSDSVKSHLRVRPSQLLLVIG